MSIVELRCEMLKYLDKNDLIKNNMFMINDGLSSIFGFDIGTYIAFDDLDNILLKCFK